MDDLTEKLKKMKVPHESIEQGSEFATPRDYRALGRNTAIDEIILMLKKTETAPHEKEKMTNEEKVAEIVDGIEAIAKGCAAVALTKHNAALVEKWKGTLAKKILALIDTPTHTT